MTSLFAFELGREYRLSIAELWKVFPEGSFVYTDQKIAILGNISKESILTTAPRL